MALTYKCGVCGREGDEHPRVMQCGICSVLLCYKHYKYGVCEMHFDDLAPTDREALKLVHEHTARGTDDFRSILLLTAGILAPIVAVIICVSLASMVMPEPLFWLVVITITTSAVLTMVGAIYFDITRFMKRRENMQGDDATIESILRRYILSYPNDPRMK